jgi:hypothetical protein
MKEELQGLLLQAKQMEAEQKAKLDRIKTRNHKSVYTEYEIGILSGIKRIVLLIERHIERITESEQYVIELSDEELKIVTAEELAEMEKSAMEFDGFLGFTVRGRLVR